MSFSTAVLMNHTDTLNDKIGLLHQRILESFPQVDRMACALYDKNDDLLKTFINSTRHGVALKAYEFKLSDSKTLSKLIQRRQSRVLSDIENEITSKSVHTRWLNDQGYCSSFTIPMFHGDDLLGLVFFDSMEKSVFTDELQKFLMVYSSLISMFILNELASIRTLTESIRVARDLAEVRDFETGTHLERMARYSRIIAKSISSKFNLSDEFVECVYLFAPLHDVGKIGIPDSILLKPGRLDDQERLMMQSHVVKGVQIVDRIIGRSSDENLVNSTILRNIVRAHHEYLDGSGYPLGLKGGEIPLESRIVTVADIYDALTTSRPYKAVWSQEEALKELRKMQVEGRLDKDCVDALFLRRDELFFIQGKYFDKV